MKANQLARNGDGGSGGAAPMAMTSQYHGGGGLGLVGAGAPQSAGGASFNGWMIAGAPALGVLEHPLYDLRVASCR